MDPVEVQAIREGQILPYLSTAQLASVTPWSVVAIEKMVARGVLVKGVHFFQPFGRRSQRIFKWEAVRSLIEGGTSPIAPRCEISTSRVRPSAAGKIDVGKATTELQRLLG